MAGIYRILFDPVDHTTLYALDFHGRVWRSTNAGANSASDIPALPTEFSGAALQGATDARTMIITPLGELWVASEVGLARSAAAPAPGFAKTTPPPDTTAPTSRGGIATYPPRT